MWRDYYLSHGHKKTLPDKSQGGKNNIDKTYAIAFTRFVSFDF